MKYAPFVLLLCAGAAYGQLLPSLSWGSSGIGGPGRPGPPGGYGKPPPGRPSPYGSPGGGGFPPRGEPAGGPPNFDDPIPPLQGDHSYDTPQLPSRLPILAPNGVVEIYNRVVDDLIKKLEMDFRKRELDPMAVVIRPTPPGPVRVPGYLQKRPFRRPGAALYRSSVPALGGSSVLSSVSSSSSSSATNSKKQQKRARSGVLPPETRFSAAARPAVDDDKPSFRGSGKISKGPLEVVDDEKEMLETTASPVVSTTVVTPRPNSEEKSVSNSTEVEGSSEEDDLFGGMKISRSDEYFPDPDDDESEGRAKAKKEKPKKKEESEEEEDDEDKAEGQKDVDTLIQRYQSKNTNKSKDKYTGGKKPNTGNNKKDENRPVVQDPEDEEEILTSAPEKAPTVKSKSNVSPKKKIVPEVTSDEGDDDEDEDDEPEFRDEINDDEFGPEPGTGGGQRPQGGYYPPGGPPAIPAKPNAELTGLSRIKRSADVSVSVDARSAIITARLLVGPLNVIINESSEPMEKNVRATIPELEAELLLMERHGVVFLQRFTLDRAYGQDVEISIPKSKNKDKKKGSLKIPSNIGGPQNPQDPNHPINVESRRQTKMAAHISMEVVKLLRSGNLRVNLMRTAQGAMSKLKLPIQKAKSKKSKGRKDKVKPKKENESSEQED